MTQAAIGLGSNLGDRASHLSFALDRLAQLGEVVSTSSVYETDPVGPVPQGAFLNAVVVLRTELSAHDLLGALGAVEDEAGRERLVPQGPRTLDLDLLVFGWEEIETEALIVPHPELAQRRFVLEPLVEAWPEVVVPGRGPATRLLEEVGDQGVVKLTGSSDWSTIS